MFAPRYQFTVGELRIEMGPPRNLQEVEVFAELLSSPQISRYLGRSVGYTLEYERDWYEKTRADDSLCWLLFDVTDGARVLIGNTGLRTCAAPLQTYVSGVQICRPEYWGRGIAGAAHRVRTWYAFSRTGAVCLRSAVYAPNGASRRAIESVGYVHVATERNQLWDDGSLVHKLNFECINPTADAWKRWWHDEDAPADFVAARQLTRRAMRWAQRATLPCG